MIVYNVTIKIDPSVNNTWLTWMRDQHIPDVMKTGLFFDYKMFRLMELNETDGITYTIQYFCDSFENYQQYQKDHAPRLQQEHQHAFNNKFVAFRTLMRSV